MITEEDAAILYKAHQEFEYGDDTLLELLIMRDGPSYLYEVTDKLYSERHKYDGK